MTLTPYHARYYAMLLTKRSGAAGAERYLPALMSANIDLHPHQIDAALFASRSQFSEGVILADEEGLGKTVEAGIALLQAWIEGRAKLLVLCPAPLLPHWRSELDEKFSLSCIGLPDMDKKPGVLLLSYMEAYKNAAVLAAAQWDLCVLDDAHRLANAGLTDRVMSDAIREALAGRPKLLLTDSPMQNSLLDLYYLIRFVDETTFGSDPEVFRARYMGNKPLKQELAHRAQLICQRTLRRQALTMQLPRRIVRTMLVYPTPEEEALSKRMSLYFHRENLAAFPKIKEHYIRLTYWKLLASQAAALCDSLAKVVGRLETMPQAEDEYRDLCEVLNMAQKIKTTARSHAFLDTLKDAMQKLKLAGAPGKAVIFSENRRTLSFLHDLLSENGYKNKVVTYGAGERGQQAARDFKGNARILLATDSAVTGLSLPYCACVINYDLPYNVQKLERRISVCHCYGQKHDVMVLNFLDPTNRADKRIYALLNKKLKAFDNLFGASETVLGDVQSTYSGNLPDARTKEEIAAEQALFERENEQEITRRTKKAAADLLAHFDDVVWSRFKLHAETIPDAIAQMENMLWAVTKHKLQNKATIQEEARRVIIEKSPYKGLRLSRISFGMDKSLPKGERYRLDHPLARRVLNDCMDGELTEGSITLEAGGKFTPGMSGVLGLWRCHLMSGTHYQTQPVLCGYINGGAALSHEDCVKLMELTPISCSGGAAYKDKSGQWIAAPAECKGQLCELRDRAFEDLREKIALEQDEALSGELDKLRRWAADEAAALTARQQDMAAHAAKLRADAQGAANFNERFRLNKELVDFEKQRGAQEERLFYLGAEIQRRRDELMAAAREKVGVKFWEEMMFILRWRVGEVGFIC